MRAQLVYFIVTGQLVGFLTEMVVPFALKKLMPKAKKITSKATQKKSEPSSNTNVDAAIVQDEDEKKFMEKVYTEVALEEYNIYTDYVEMVIQVITHR